MKEYKLIKTQTVNEKYDCDGFSEIDKKINMYAKQGYTVSKMILHPNPFINNSRGSGDFFYILFEREI